MERNHYAQGVKTASRQLVADPQNVAGFDRGVLGAAFIHLGWLGLFSTPLWGGLILSIAFGYAVFRWV